MLGARDGYQHPLQVKAPYDFGCDLQWGVSDTGLPLLFHNDLVVQAKECLRCNVFMQAVITLCLYSGICKPCFSIPGTNVYDTAHISRLLRPDATFGR